MLGQEVLYAFDRENARVQVFSSREAGAAAAALRAAHLISTAIQKRGKARMIVATGNSQLAFIDQFVKQPLDWNAIEAFHMDEYAHIKETHPSSFRYWIKTRFENQVHPSKMHYIAGDAPDLDSEMKRYADLLMQAPIDLAFVGFGENGHIAFNDPPVADFDDPEIVKRVTLDEACRRQQAGEGHFRDAALVPREAITVTCSELFRADAWICCVPEARKARAVRAALEYPISTSCPASLVRKHQNSYVYLDRESASLLSSSLQHEPATSGKELQT